MSSSILIHPPRSDAPELANTATGFDRKAFMGSWHVVWSTLPMWKTNKDVVITYTQRDGSGADYTVFNSVVAYRSRSGGAMKEIGGVERLTPDTNGANFDWRGNGWMRLLHSHWEVLGHGVDDGGVEWCATFFGKTLFTPAGLDLYLRPVGGGGLTEEQRAAVIEAVRPVLLEQSGDVGRLAAGGFVVP